MVEQKENIAVNKDEHAASDNATSKPHQSSEHSDKDKHPSSSATSKSTSSSQHKDKLSVNGTSSNHTSSSKHHSSSSHKHLSSKDKEVHNSSLSKDGVKSSSKDKEGGKSSSSSKEKDGSKSSSKGVAGNSTKPSSGDKVKHSSNDKHKDKHKHEDKKVKVEGSGSKSNQAVTTPSVVVKTESVTPTKVIKTERTDDSEDDIPLVARKVPKVEPKTTPEVKVKAEPKTTPEVKVKAEKRPAQEDSDDEPLTARLGKKNKTEKKHDKDVKKESHKEPKKEIKKEPLSKKRKGDKIDQGSPKKKKTDKDAKHKGDGDSPKKGKKKEEEQTSWKWWEEGPRDDGIKWKTLEHKGPLFAAPYEPLPASVKFYYNGKLMKLSPDTEEVAGFYGRMLDHDYTTKDVFNKNFFRDWKKVMTKEESEVIKDLKLCNFNELNDYYKLKSEERKNKTKEEKKVIKDENARIQAEYGWCILDGHKQKIGNFKIEPPGLFRGRGDHPKQGMLKKRVVPEQVMINCSKGSKVPPPPPGHKWQEVRHDNTVSWLASWTENVQNQVKYVMLAATSRLKGEKDWKKYQMAQKLHKIIDKIRENYREDWKSKEMRIRQRAVAMYFIDKLALRAGNEKDEDTADTVGCCSLRYEHIKLHEHMDGNDNVVEFDFLGKDSIRYHNTVSVEKRVFKNLQLFIDNKQNGDDLFDRLNTTILNKHLSSIMPGLSAKVFRTYNASRTLEEQLNLLTDANDPVPAKILTYNRANRAVAILCNHQRSAPKTFDKQMENMQSKIEAKEQVVREAKKDVKSAKADVKVLKTEAAKKNLERKQNALERAKDQLSKLLIQKTDKSENKEIALGTSKLNYLDPRISVAWCKRWQIPLEKVYNKTQREKFAWAIDMADKNFSFLDYNENYDVQEGNESEEGEED